MNLRSLATLGYDPVTVDRIEVLKGPASVLFGQRSLGGTVNLVTKQPLPDPYYFLESSLGSFDFYRGANSAAERLSLIFTVRILPGWNIIAGYALTDAQITKDNTYPVGNQAL